MKDRILKKVLARNNLLETYREQEAVLLWDQVVGEMSKFTRPKKVSRGKLIVEVPSASARQELTYMEEEFLRELNRRLEGSELKEIKFVLGGQESLAPERSSESVNLEEVNLSSQELEEIKKTFRGLEIDQSLRRQLQSLAIKQKKAEKARLAMGWSKCPNCGRTYRGKSCPDCS
ncbi:MAG: DUF721 domain-containing protein [Candidatus Bipolaricaulota bacterium]